MYHPRTASVLSHILSPRLCDEKKMKNAHKHLAHYAKAPAAGNTSPTGWQEGEERKSVGSGGGGGSGGEGDHGWVGGWLWRVGSDEKVRKSESRHNECCYQLCLQAFPGRGGKVVLNEKCWRRYSSYFIFTVTRLLCSGGQ